MTYKAMGIIIYDLYRYKFVVLLYYIHIHIVKGSWEAILPSYGQIEF